MGHSPRVGQVSRVGGGSELGWELRVDNAKRERVGVFEVYFFLNLF